MILNFLEIITLSAIQGITEFLPISSSAHLILTREVLQFQVKSIFIDTGMHLGSLLAIIIYFKSDLFKILENKKLLSLIIFGSIPTIIVGAIMYMSGVINYFRSIEIIAWTSFIFAILLYISDKCKVKKNYNNDINLKSILIIGLFQIVSLVPGVSRSGIVITAGRFLNFDRYDSSKISFYLSIPALSGAAFLSLKDLNFNNSEFNITILYGIFFSFIFSYLTIKYFLIFIKKFSLTSFVIYRIILSLILFYFLYN